MADTDFSEALFGDEPVATEPEPAPVENEATVQEEINATRDDALAALEAQPEPAPEPAPEAPKEAQHVPLATFLDKRDEARELKRRLEAYEAREREQQKRPEIDPFDDPAGYAAQLEQRIEQGRVQERFAISDRFARKEHGAETVDAAVQWAQQRAQEDPTFAAGYMREADPVDWIVQQHKRDALLSDIGGNVDDWFAREAAKRGFAPLSATPASAIMATPPQAPPPAKVPRSLATQGSGPSDIREVATGALAAVDAVFPS